MRKDRQTDRQTDLTKLIVAFRNFAKAPKNEMHHSESIEIGTTKYHTQIAFKSIQ